MNAIKKFYLPVSILILVISSCTTLSRIEIDNLERIKFEPLSLIPAIETNDLRIDMIRQSYENQINDSTAETLDTDYHPLGFDLGNGMFFDLNDNLCFRLDELLGLSELNCWSLEKNSRKRQLWSDCIFTFCNDSLSMTYPPGRRERYQNHRVTKNGTTSVMWRNRMLYAIDFDEDKVVYRYKRRKLDVVRKVDDNQYTLRSGFRNETFRLQGNRLLLKRNYIIEQSDDLKKIKIIRPGIFRYRVLLTVERGRESIYLYDRNYHGRKIVYTPDGLSVYQNKVFLTGWKLW
jgi:hypothetical protein